MADKLNEAKESLRCAIRLHNREYPREAFGYLLAAFYALLEAHEVPRIKEIAGCTLEPLTDGCAGCEYKDDHTFVQVITL